MRTLLLCLSILFLAGCKPDLPIAVVFRDSAVGMGKVMRVKNESEYDLTMTLECKNSAMKQELTHNFALSANDTTELGWLELGWIFQPGEEVYFKNSYYGTVWYRVP